jgi:hypothetical protein
VVGYGALIRIGSRLVVVFMAWGLVLIFGYVAMYLAGLSPAEREKSDWTYICIILAMGPPIAVGVISGKSISKMSIHYIILRRRYLICEDQGHCLVIPLVFIFFGLAARNLMDSHNRCQSGVFKRRNSVCFKEVVRFRKVGYFQTKVLNIVGYLVQLSGALGTKRSVISV